MRLVTFNVKHGDPAPEQLAPTCVALDADVLALQEVDRGVPRSGRRDLAAEVADATGLVMAFGAAMTLSGGDYGNALLVRGELRDVDVLRLPSGRWRAGEPRVAVLATAIVDGVQFSVAATHLGVTRGESRRQLPAVLDALQARPGPRALLGDLNRVPAELPKGALEWARGAATFPAARPVLRIDHIGVDGFTIDEVEVVKAAVSDHRALVVTVRPAGG